MKSVILVFIGGGAGSICRFLITKWLNPAFSAFPLGTFISNLISSFVLGLILGFFLMKGKGQFLTPLVTIGFCGGFSTFSTFSNETFQLFSSGAVMAGLLNIAVNVLVCMIAVGTAIKLVSIFY